MPLKFYKNNSGFTLIEILVFLAIFGILLCVALFIGLPQYNTYVVSIEKQYLVDALLESRVKSLTGEGSFVVATLSNGYCIQDETHFCIFRFQKCA
jgi:prepilin-type N-terminal cleavage/methylation domain-containing protein